jgi:CheY-like chemotaxis protein
VDATGHSVLVVDDDDEIRETLRVVLESEGYAVRMAADGAQALAALDTQPPCFVVLDLMMPAMDGWEVAGHMHDEERLRRIPVCVVTAAPEWAPSDAMKVLRKPIDFDELLATVQAGCSHRH